MKNGIFILVLLLSNQIYGQFTLDRAAVNPDEKVPKEYTLSAFSYSNSGRLYVGLEGGMLSRKHLFLTGIGVEPSPRYGISFQNYALTLDYNYFPNGYYHRFDLFFYLNMNFEFPYFMRPVYDQQWQQIAIKKGVDNVQTYFAGFGFNTNLSQRFFIKSGIGLGLYIERFRFPE